MGTEWAFQCDACSEPFTLASPWRHMTPELIGIVVLVAIVALYLVPGASWWLGGVAGLIVVLVVRGAYVACRDERAHPEIESEGR